MNLRKILLASAALFMMASCSSNRGSLTYFNDIKDKTSGVLPLASYAPAIEPDDELFINVSSALPEASQIYNLPQASYAVVGEQTEQSRQYTLTYVVSQDGDINMPMLGKIHVAGMTTEQLAQKLTDKISEGVKDPVVTVTLVNFKVNVAGEVRTPGRIEVNGNRISVLDALTAAGDLTEYGERSNVLVIREENGQRTFGRLNLNSSESLNSPYYYLKQNDYVYVEPNQIRQDNSKYNQNNAFKLTVTSTIVSAASVIASLIIALTVK